MEKRTGIPVGACKNQGRGALGVLYHKAQEPAFAGWPLARYGGPVGGTQVLYHANDCLSTPHADAGTSTPEGACR